VSGDTSVFEERGVKEWVWQARGYVPYTKDDPAPAKELYVDLNREQRGFITKVLNQCDGWAIVRYAPPMFPALPPICAELRPGGPVVTQGPQIHCHRDGPPLTNGEFLEQAASLGLKVKVDQSRSPNDPCPDWILLAGQPGSKQWAEHTERGLKQIDKGKKPPRDAHCGKNVQVLHKHQSEAKYVFPPQPKIDVIYEHEHSTSWKRVAESERPAKRKSHVEKYHDGVDITGGHTHVRRVKDPSAPPLARRLDVNPLAVQKLLDDPVVFFALEGCIKADAILSAGAAVFSVPSVTLWDVPELERFAYEYLLDKVVVIVPDADWSDNLLVVNQARMCEAHLFRLGVPETHVAAPPPAFLGMPTNGCDDFLAAHGRLEDLVVLDYELPTEIYEWVARHGVRRDRAHRDVEAIRALSTYTGPSGRFEAPLQTLAHVMGLHRESVSRVIHRLEDLGAVTIDGSLRTKPDYFSRQEEWWKRPPITLIPELRSHDKPEQRLGDLVPLVTQKGPTRWMTLTRSIASTA
jgi:hypothetical protein